MLAVVLLPAAASAQTQAEVRAKFESELLAVGQMTTPRPVEGGSSGPDVTVIYLNDVTHYTSGGAVNGKRAYSLGTTSCNVGDEPVAWCDHGGCGQGMGDEDHPVIAQNLFRLKDGTFEQIGMSWLKHGFLSTNSFDGACGSCQQPPGGGAQLGVGCTDTYGSGLNGSRPLGLRSEVNATTGLFPFPYTDMCDQGFCPTAIDQRIQVLQDDLDPALNPGALYFMEGQYVTGDDALEGNGLNNASYRRATVNASYTIALTGSTAREQSALYAWQAQDPDVEVVDVDLLGLVGKPTQRFEAARTVRSAPGGYRYEVVVRNMNSDRAAQALTVQFPGATAFSNEGFRDVDHHSGEPYSTADWELDVDEAAGTIRWFTDDFSTDPDANALRWGTAFTFRFEADRLPEGATFTLALFRPGLPLSLPIPFTGLGPLLFADGFETGDTGGWDETTN